LAPALAALAAPWHAARVWQRLLDATYLEVSPPALRAQGERLWPTAQPLRPCAAAALPGDRLPAAFDALPFERTVALSLGTVFNGAYDVFDAALAGLRTLRVNVVAITGPGSDPTRLGPQPRHVLVERCVPYAMLLPRVDALLSHGGAGGVFAALGRGLPQLLMPQGADQHTNAQACVRAGAALAIDTAPVHAGDVAAMTARLLDEPQYARAADAVRRQIVDMPDAAAVLELLLARDPAATSVH
jgi:UDP:flavonoid glycosyltransferase YjiC (YdhE family)